ncbi:MAG: carbohydrate-binding protein, partial [Phycisphaerales bacterium]|nr:carbohydrate-binding protein [Phycisphaerales bacterium]
MNMGSHIPHALSLAVTLLTTTCLQADDDIESAGLGSFYTSIPAGQMGPTDTDGNPVMPQVTSDFNGPAPTNTWWSSLIWKRYPGANFGQVMHAHPLSMKAEAEGLRIGHANTSFPTGAGYGYHFTASQHALTIGVQGLQASEVKVADASDWTVTADWKDDSNSMQATFGRGLPVVRASANNGVLIVSINAGSGGASNISIEGTRVILECAGASWGLFGPDGTSWSQSGDTFLASGTNVISVALMPDTEIETVDLFTDRAMIDVQDTRVSWIWNPEKRTVDATYRFTTDSQKKPLVCLYGHQAAHADQSNMDNWGEYISARGPMMLTDCHEFTVSLPCPPVLPLLPDVGSVDTDRLEELIAQVVDDDQFASDTYWFGKGVGRHGQLALLADQIGNTVYRDQLLEVMKNELESWLSVNASSDDLSSSDRLQAEYASETYGVTIEDVNGADGQAVTGINGGDWIQLSSVNFSASLPNRALIRLASGTSGSGMVSIRLDSIDGPVIAQAGVGNTGGWTNWTELALGIAVNDPTILEGEHDVYITCDTPYAEDICTLDWFTFDYGGGGSSDRYFAHDPIWSTLIGYPASYGADQELNDHHFHYGYYIMAASVIARFDPDWARPEAWGGMIELLIKDAANWDRNDERFCFLRHLEPYVGYSYAAGHAGFAAGNNQESSSEGMNFAAAVVHWGSETGNEEIRDLGLYLMASETQAIEQYWFDVDQSVFPDEMPHPVAGIVWDSGADYATWWTGNPEEIHGINVLPVTASSLYLGQRPDSIDRCWDHL